MGDPIKLLQVFKNLFENAIIHGKPSLIRISCTSNNTNSILNIENDGTIITDKAIDQIKSRSFNRLGVHIIMKILDANEWKLDLSNENNLTHT